MDMYNTATWLQSPQNIHGVSHAQLPDGRPSSSTSWKEDTASGDAPEVGTSASGQAGIDMHDFGIDLNAVPSTSTAMSSTSQAFYNHYSPHNYFMPGPFNAMPYGSMQWANQSLPLSNYSSLDGATSSTLPSQSSSAPTQHSLSHSMMIDPSLTTINGSESARQQLSHSPNPSSQPSQSGQPRQYSAYQHPTLSINPSYVLPSSFYSSQSQQAAQSQGTLSPHVLHASSPTTTNNTAQSLYSPPIPSASTSSAADIQARKDRFLQEIKPLLQPKSFTGAGAVNSLVGIIDDFGSQNVDASTRMDILTKIRDNAGNHYFRAWSENDIAMDITKEWLKAGFTATEDNGLVETIMPLLHVVDRMPLTVDSLKKSKLGKIVVKLVKEPPAPAIKDMASNLERKWRQLVDAARAESDSQDDKSKKRKLAESPSSKALPPAKKAAVGSAVVKPVVVKKEVKPAVTGVKDARSDSSFFSAPKPKPKLPSFKKAPAEVKKESLDNIAQPSSFDPFQDALKSMAKARKDSPAAVVLTPPPMPVSMTPVSSTNSGKGKKNKSVSWAPDSQLVAVKLIERAVYEDDPMDGVHHAHSLRDLDRGEGAALHVPLFEEIMDWSEPILIERPGFLDTTAEPGSMSEEKAVQETREQTALNALYMSAAQIPDSPGEPASVLADNEMDQELKQMTVGEENDNVFWSNENSPPPNATAASVAELVGQLTAGNTGQMMNNGGDDGSASLQSLGLDPTLLSQLSALQPLQSIPPTDQMAQLLQQAQAMLGQGQQGGGSALPPYAGGDQNWDAGNYGSEYGQQQGRQQSDVSGDARGGRWDWRGRGKGRGRGRGDGPYRHNHKRTPCSFYAEGRCKYGDQCDFSHEAVY